MTMTKMHNKKKQKNTYSLYNKKSSILSHFYKIWNTFFMFHNLYLLIILLYLTMITDLLNLLIGFSLILISFSIILNYYKLGKINFFFFLLIFIAGISRFQFGLVLFYLSFHQPIFSVSNLLFLEKRVGKTS